MSENLRDKGNQSVFINCTLSEAIDAFGFGSYQLLLAVCLGITIFSFAVEITSLIIIQPLLECGWEVSEVQNGYILTNIATIMAIALAAPVWGYASDRFGRRPVIMISVFVQIILIISITLVPDNVWFLMLRIFFGCSLASFPIFYVLLAEYNPSTSRGQSAMFLQIFWIGGGILTMLLSWSIVKVPWSWRLVAMVGVSPLILFIALSYWLPESVLYLSKMGKEDELGYQINSVASFNGKLDILDQMEINNILTDEDNEHDPCLELFQLILGPDNLCNSLIIWSLWFLNGIAYYGAIFATPAINDWLSSCYNHQEDEITMLHIETVESELCSLIDSKEYEHFVWNSLAEFPAIIIGAFAIDFLGRRKTYLICTGIYAVSLSPLIIRHCLMDTTSPFVFLFIARGAGMAWFSNNIVFSLENYSTKTRCTGLGIGFFIMQLGAVFALSIKSFLIPYSVTIFIFVYFVASVLGFLLGMYLPKETTRADLSYVGEVMMDEIEPILIHNGQSDSIEIERKLQPRKAS